MLGIVNENIIPNCALYKKIKSQSSVFFIQVFFTLEKGFSVP